MRIGVISDTHGDQAAIRQVAKAVTNVDMWLHAGDCSQDGEYLRNLVTVPVFSARGNCDGYTTAKIDEFVETHGHKIWLTHGHRYGVKHGTQELEQLGKLYEVDAVIYGHTHIPDNHWHEGILIFNPGSAYGSRATYGFLDINADGQIVASIIQLN